MARIIGNETLQLSGKIGGIVIRITKTGSFACKLPDFTDTKFSAPQTRSANHFSNAVKHAQQILRDPKKKRAYERAIKNGSTVYHFAIAEYMARLKK